MLSENTSQDSAKKAVLSEVSAKPPQVERMEDLVGAQERDELIVRFWSFVKRGKPNECWPWTAGKTGQGYGAFYLGNRQVLAHRFSHLLSCGSLDSSVVVRHICDNPPCCNPAHILGGTQKDNIQDCVRRHRFPKGIKHPSAKLTPDQVKEIRVQYFAGKVSQKSLSVTYGVTQSLISGIVRFTRWT